MVKVRAMAWGRHKTKMCVHFSLFSEQHGGCSVGERDAVSSQAATQSEQVSSDMEMDHLTLRLSFEAIRLWRDDDLDCWDMPALRLRLITGTTVLRETGAECTQRERAQL